MATPASAAATPATPASAAVTAPSPSDGASAALSPSQVRRGLNLSVIEGAFATVHISITGAIGGSVFLTGFAMLLGANSFQLGMLGALPFIGQAFQFVSAYLEERVGQRKPLVFYGALFGRLVWALLLALPFLPFLDGAAIPIFLLALACSYAFNGIAGNAWMSWMSELVPARERGRYFGFRNMVMSLVTMGAAYSAGLILDAFTARGQVTAGYATIFSVALVAGVISAALVRLKPEPPLQRSAERARIGDLAGAALSNPRFRSFALLATGWMLVTGIAGPFFNAYGLSTLKLSFATLSFTAIATSAVALISQPFIGRLQDSWGDRKVLIISIAGTVLLPLGWVFSTPDNIIPLWLTSIFSGVFWPGVNQGLANIMMDRAPSTGRGAAIAAYSTITGLGTLTAGLLGGAIASLLADASLALGPLSLTSLSLLFVITCLGRFVMLLVFWRTL